MKNQRHTINKADKKKYKCIHIENLKRTQF